MLMGDGTGRRKAPRDVCLMWTSDTESGDWSGAEVLSWCWLLATAL